MMIKEAAILHNGIIYSGKRHAFIIGRYYPIIGKFGSTEIQGFITTDGQFLNRQEAAQHAFDCGQTTEHKQTLYSEDLY